MAGNIPGSEMEFGNCLDTRLLRITVAVHRVALNGYHGRENLLQTVPHPRSPNAPKRGQANVFRILSTQVSRFSSPLMPSIGGGGDVVN